MLRLYFSNVLMGILDYIITITFSEMESNIFRTIFISVQMYDIYERIKKNEIKIPLLCFFWQIVSCVILKCLIDYTKISSIFITSIVASVLGSICFMDYGIFFLILALTFYIFHDNKKKLIIGFGVYTFCYTCIFQFNIFEHIMQFVSKKFLMYEDIVSYLCVAFLDFLPMNFNRHSLIWDNYVWMMFFSSFFIYFYNGKRGKNYKYFFYIYYPMHLIILVLFANY